MDAIVGVIARYPAEANEHSLYNRPPALVSARRRLCFEESKLTMQEVVELAVILAALH